MASLAIIEQSPASTAVAIHDSAPPPYTDSKDDSDDQRDSKKAESDPLVASAEMAQYKPITASIIATRRHLRNVGGFNARWRGLGLALLYNLLHVFLSSVLSSVFDLGVVGDAFCGVFASVGLARLHMAWTHKMITYPSSKSWISRLPAGKDTRGLLVASVVYAVAQQVSILLPLGVASVLGVSPSHADHMRTMAIMHHGCPHAIISFFLRLLAVPLTHAVVSLAVLLPASVTLTRVEAALLPDGEETVVPFDKYSVTNGKNPNVCGNMWAIFVQAWRSFDRPSRLRLIKLYVKMGLMQVTTLLVTLHLMMLQVYIIGGEKFGAWVHSVSARPAPHMESSSFAVDRSHGMVKLPNTIELPEMFEVSNTIELPNNVEMPDVIAVEVPDMIEITKIVELPDMVGMTETIELPNMVKVPDSIEIVETIEMPEGIFH